MRRPYRLITPHNPCRTLAQGDVRCFATMMEAANAFVQSNAPYRTVVYDDGCDARELNSDEARLLENVCARLGYTLEDVVS